MMMILILRFELYAAQTNATDAWTADTNKKLAEVRLEMTCPIRIWSLNH